MRTDAIVFSIYTHTKATLPPRKRGQHKVGLLQALLASDKAQLTNFSGGKVVHPLYSSLGNIDKNVRSLGHMRAWPLIALLPVFDERLIDELPPSMRRNEETVRALRRAVFHASLRVVLDALRPYAER
jgi:hypothetical protein